MPRSIRRSSILVACLIGGAIWLPSATPGAATKGGNTKGGNTKGATEVHQEERSPEGGRRVPGDGDRPARAGVDQRRLADWAAATDVTPEHTGQRTGADKALAALVGLDADHRARPRRCSKNEKQLDELTVRQLRKLLLAAAESPGTIPEVVAKRVEPRRSSRASWTATPSACSRKGGDLRQADHRQRHRRHPAQVARPQRAAARLDGVEGDRPAAQARA